MIDSRSALLSNLKETVFYDLLNMTGRVFIVIKFSESVIVGNRGFLPEEKENGLVLVFNSGMRFRWEGNAIDATLSFGLRTEKCYIPADDIIAIYSPEAQAQFITAPSQSVTTVDDRSGKEDNAPSTEGKEKNENVVRVDFRSKKK